MNKSPKTASEIVKTGFDRVCAEFSEAIEPLGFKRVNKRSRTWCRHCDYLVEKIYFHRSGSSYGAPINNSVSLRVHFSVHAVDAEPLSAINALTSDQLRDERGYAYHLRFNALTWSTYERCVEDLNRVLHDHGLPWFVQQHTA